MQVEEFQDQERKVIEDQYSLNQLVIVVTEVVVEETRMKEVAEDHSVRMRRCEACLALEPVDKEEESVQEQTQSVSEQEQEAAQDSQLSCSGTG